MISKESSDAEDWSYGWWKSSFAIKELIILKYTQIENRYFKL